MMWRTHFLFGTSALWLLAPIPSDLLSLDYGAMALFAGMGALLPDLDASESKIKHLRVSRAKPFELAAIALHRTLGHRGALHSLAGLGLVSLSALPLALSLGWGLWIALLLGYASHLAADACTRQGIPLLYPKKAFHHLLHRMFHLTYQHTITQEIHRSRIGYARHLLLHSSMNANEIARACGFRNANYFRYLFRRYEGITPMAFRRLNGHLRIDSE
jgi:inner membrane protein